MVSALALVVLVEEEHLQPHQAPNLFGVVRIIRLPRNHPGTLMIAAAIRLLPAMCLLPHQIRLMILIGNQVQMTNIPPPRHLLLEEAVAVVVVVVVNAESHQWLDLVSVAIAPLV